MQKNTIRMNNTDPQKQLSGFYCNQNTTAASKKIKCERQRVSLVVLRRGFMETSCATKQPSVYNQSPLAMALPTFHTACLLPCERLHQCVFLGMNRPQMDDRQAHGAKQDHLNVNKVVWYVLG